MGLRDVGLLFCVCTWKMCGTGFPGDHRPTNPPENGGGGEGGGKPRLLATLLQGNALFSASTHHGPSLIPN